MAHLNKDQLKLANRAKRIRGQAEAVERALTAGEHCATVLQQLAACRGAIDGLMAELLEHHIREHIGKAKPSPQVVEDVVEIIHAYLK